MKIVQLCLLSLSVLAGPAWVHAQTADEIISKHLEAIGGKDKLSGIHSVRLENTVQVMGNEAPSTTVVLNGKGYRNESEFNGQQMVQVYTDKGGWSINPMAGSSDPQNMPEEQYKAGQEQIYVIPLLDYAARGGKAEYLGQEKVGNANAYKVKLTSQNNAVTTYFFDPSSYYLLRVVRTANMMGAPTDITATYSDFKKTDYGWVVPQTVDLDFGGRFSLSTKVNKVEVNNQVDAGIFEMKK